MSKFLCHCGNIISDVVVPCPFTGEIKWDDEMDAEENERTENLKEFLTALENGRDKEWIRSFFGEQYAASYPSGMTVVHAIEDIYSRSALERHRGVIRCGECERLYLQTEPYVNEWICYEKRDETK